MFFLAAVIMMKFVNVERRLIYTVDAVDAGEPLKLQLQDKFPYELTARECPGCYADNRS